MTVEETSLAETLARSCGKQRVERIRRLDGGIYDTILRRWISANDRRDYEILDKAATPGLGKPKPGLSARP